MPLASPAPPAAVPQAAQLPQQPAPRRAPPPRPAPTVVPPRPTKRAVDASAAMQPVAIAAEKKPSTVVRGRSKKRNPLVTMVVGFLVTSAILTGGLVLGGMLMRGLSVGDWKEENPEPYAVKKQVGGRVQPEESGYRPKGPRLDINRQQFRDKMEELSYEYDTRYGYNVYRSGRDLVDAFGQPHRIRPVGDEIFYYWNCSDKTLKVVCEPSATPLENRASLIVYRIDNEWY